MRQTTHPPQGWWVVVLILPAALLVLIATDPTDQDGVPYTIVGLRPIVIGPNGDAEDLETIDTFYPWYTEALAACEDAADAYAQWAGWGQHYSYVCCTVTLNSDCVTKVR
jgi:hypothetical protein